MKLRIVLLVSGAGEYGSVTKSVLPSPVFLFFLFEHLAPGAIALPNNCILKKMKKRKDKEKQFLIAKNLKSVPYDIRKNNSLLETSVFSIFL